MEEMRTITNISGATYDPLKTHIVFAEDMNAYKNNILSLDDSLKVLYGVEPSLDAFYDNGGFYSQFSFLNETFWKGTMYCTGTVTVRFAITVDGPQNVRFDAYNGTEMVSHLIWLEGGGDWVSFDVPVTRGKELRIDVFCSFFQPVDFYSFEVFGAPSTAPLSDWSNITNVTTLLE